MNKYEFRSAYDKIALSPKFKAEARAKLTAQFGKAREHISSEVGVEEQRVSSEMKLTPKEKKPWKTVLGLISAAAVVTLGIWGGSFFIDQGTITPASDPETSEVSHTEESSEPAKDFGLVENTVTFPAYYDMVTEHNAEIFEVLPFEVSISLPEGWSISVPEEKGGFSAVELRDENGRVIGGADFNTYEIYEGMTPDSPEYYRMVYNQLMLNSMVSWDHEYTPVKREGGFCSATCRVISDEPELADVSSYGILAHSDDIRAYVNISVDAELEPELHADIARSVEFSEDVEGIAERVAEDYSERWDSYTVSVTSVPVEGGHLLAMANAEHQDYSATLYLVVGGRFTVLDNMFCNEGRIYQGENCVIAELTDIDDFGNISYCSNAYFKIAYSGGWEYLGGAAREERNGEDTYMKLDPNDINGIIPCTYEEYLSEKIRLMQGHSKKGEFSFDDFEQHGGDVERLADRIAEAIRTENDSSRITQAELTAAEKQELQQLLTEFKEFVHGYILCKEAKEHISESSFIAEENTRQDGTKYQSRWYRLVGGEITAYKQLEDKINSLCTADMAAWLDSEQIAHSYRVKGGDLYLSENAGHGGGVMGSDLMYIDSVEAVASDTLRINFIAHGDKDYWELEQDSEIPLSILVRKDGGAWRIQECGINELGYIAWLYDSRYDRINADGEDMSEPPALTAWAGEDSAQLTAVLDVWGDGSQSNNINHFDWTVHQGAWSEYFTGGVCLFYIILPNTLPFVGFF